MALPNVPDGKCELMEKKIGTERKKLWGNSEIFESGGHIDVPVHL